MDSHSSSSGPQPIASPVANRSRATGALHLFCSVVWFGLLHPATSIHGYSISVVFRRYYWYFLFLTSFLDLISHIAGGYGGYTGVRHKQAHSRSRRQYIVSAIPVAQYCSGVHNPGVHGFRLPSWHAKIAS